MEKNEKIMNAVNQANPAPDSAMQELDKDKLDNVSGGVLDSHFNGIFEDVPVVKEHPYDPKDTNRY